MTVFLFLSSKVDSENRFYSLQPCTFFEWGRGGGCFLYENLLHTISLTAIPLHTKCTGIWT